MNRRLDKFFKVTAIVTACIDGLMGVSSGVWWLCLPALWTGAFLILSTEIEKAMEEPKAK